MSMIGECEFLVRPERRPPYQSSSQEVTPIRPSGVMGTDVLPANNAYSRTFKKTAPRMVELLTIEFDREKDGRWIAEVPEIPGVMVYGGSREEAVSRVTKLAFSALVDHAEERPDIFDVRHTFFIEHAA